MLFKKCFNRLFVICRCDLVIFANGKTEKIASGLLNPFLAHLRAARDQMAKGGYSIILETEAGCNATWFTKATVERYVLKNGVPPEASSTFLTFDVFNILLVGWGSLQNRRDVKYI